MSRTAPLRVAVLSGGVSGEREVSLVSGKSVCAALERSVQARCLKSVRPIEIDARGRWLVGGEARDAGRALAACDDVDVFFLALHGGAGEDGTLQGLLSASGRTHTGSGVQASALCMDKAATRGLAAGHGWRIAPGHCIGERDFAAAREKAIETALALSSAKSGWVVKPRRGGSSVNTHVVARAELLEPAIVAVLASGDDALVEARVAGIEVSCGVLDSRPDSLRALPAIEIRPVDGRFFDYEQKYSTSGAREICPATSLSSAQEQRVREAALSMHVLAGCRGYSRSDFIVPEQGDPVLLEINTLPGLTPRSLLPQEAAVVGIEYDALCLWIVEAALSRNPV
ncbi:MAG TPA: D-alanine--D-alanine ligase [Planctomycetota bacterium]|nr:D-alanine--D-alanine ligase [Planctomycetota bacterium]